MIVHALCFFARLLKFNMPFFCFKLFSKSKRKRCYIDTTVAVSSIIKLII